jgi:predicted HTH domain antitoxin
MTIEVTITIPETVFSVLSQTPEEFVREMLLVSAVKWYELGKLSQSMAAEVAGISRQEFLQSLAQFNVSPFQVTPEELAEGIT